MMNNAAIEDTVTIQPFKPAVKPQVKRQVKAEVKKELKRKQDEIDI
jgi:hypothetical protein